MDLTERTLSSETVYQGKIVTLLVDQAELPNGMQAKREVVLHPGGVAILPLDRDGNVTLVQQYRPSTSCCWSCPPESWTRGRTTGWPPPGNSVRRPVWRRGS